MPRQKYVAPSTHCQLNVATFLLFNLLLQGCHSRLDALEGHCLSTGACLRSETHEQASGQVSTALTKPLSSAPRHLPPCALLSTTALVAVERPLQHAVANQAALQTPNKASSKTFTTSSGEHVRFACENERWEATLQSSSHATMPQRTFPVVSPTAIGPQLAWLQAQDIWTSKARIHIVPTSVPPYTSCVYLGKCGLFGGMFGRNNQELLEGNGLAHRASGRAVEGVVRVIPSLASLCLEALLAAHEDEYYREYAEDSLVEAAKAAPEQTLDRLLTVYKTRPGIRKTASKAFLEATKMVPEHTLGHLLTACRDASKQSAAINILKNVAMAAPQLMLTPLQAACRKMDPWVRQAAIKTLENIAKAAPELTSTCLETIMLATSRDESDLVRDSAFRVLLNVAKAVPEQALVSILAFGRDENWYARYAVIMALLEVAQAAPKHASACLQPLQDACADEDQGVCQAAVYAVEETKRALRRYERGT
jgi:HEAT repeat protein